MLSEYSLIPIFHVEVCQACLRIFSRKYIRYSSPVSRVKTCHDSLDNTFWGKLFRLFIKSQFLLNLNLFHEIPALVSLKISPLHSGKVWWTFELSWWWFDKNYLMFLCKIQARDPFTEALTKGVRCLSQDNVILIKNLKVKCPLENSEPSQCALSEAASQI